MRYAVTLLLVAGCAGGAVDDAGDREVDILAIRELAARYGEVASAANSEGYLALFTEDAVIMPPDQLPMRGKATIRPFLESAFEGIRALQGFREVTEPEEIEITGDLASDWGFTRIAVTDGGNELRVENTYLRLWERQPDGGWLISTLIWNANPSPP